MERTRGTSFVTFALLAAMALVGLALGTGPAVAEATGKTCTHEGKTYQPGSQLAIEGSLMECDGATGSWVPAQP